VARCRVPSESPCGSVDRASPGAESRRAALHRRGRQIGVADLQVDRVGVAAEDVGGDLAQCGPGAGADVDGADLDGVAAGGGVFDAGGVAGLDHRRVHAAPVPTSHSPSVWLRGVGFRVAQPNRSAPVRRHSTRRRSDHGCPVSGSTSGSLRMRNSIGSVRRRRRARPSPPPGRRCPDIRRGHASRTGRARRAWRADGWCCGSRRRRASATERRSVRRIR
jgi:hypothetical protein